MLSADWLVENLESNPWGIAVWNHHFDFEYRDTLKAPWYSALAQGQGLSLRVRAHKETNDPTYLDTGRRAFEAFLLPVDKGGVTWEWPAGDIWFEEYLLDPPTHILNGFIWALWGVYDYSLATGRSQSYRAVSTCRGHPEAPATGLRVGTLVSVRPVRQTPEECGEPILPSPSHRPAAGNSKAGR